MIVACLGDATTRFDRDYYVRRHLPLTMDCWGRYGLEAAEAFFPAGEGDAWISLGIYRFRDRTAAETALASPETERDGGRAELHGRRRDA